MKKKKKKKKKKTDKKRRLSLCRPRNLIPTGNAIYSTSRQRLYVAVWAFVAFDNFNYYIRSEKNFSIRLGTL